jgi:peroxiredoxin
VSAQGPDETTTSGEPNPGSGEPDPDFGEPNGDAGRGTTARPAFSHRPGRHGLIGPFTARQLALGLAVVVGAAVLLVAVNTPLGSASGSGPPDPRATPFLIAGATEGLHPGEVAPDFTTTRSDGSTFRLTDLDGRPISLASLKGKAVWLDFWASWCPPCQAEMPVLRRIDAEYRDRGLAIVAVSVQESSVDDVRAYAQRYDLRYTISADLSGDVFRLYRVYALPTQFFIGPDGIIRSVVQGPLDEAAAAMQVEAILPKTASE